MSLNPLNDISKVYLEQVAVDDAKKEKPKRWWDDDEDGVGYEEGEVSGKFKRKKKVEEASKPNDGNLANNYPPYDKVTRGDVIAGALGKDHMGGKKKKMKESFSNWRQDLLEVMDDTEDETQIKEKKVKNKIKINPTIGEAVEEIGGHLIEMTQIDDILDDFTDSEINLLSDVLIEKVVEEVFYNYLEEGYEIDEIEEYICESIDTSLSILTEAKVTLGHDTPDTQKKEGVLQRIKGAVKRVGKAVARGAGYAAGAAVRGAKGAAKEFKSGYDSGRSGSSGETSSSRQTSSGSSESSGESGGSEKKPGILSRVASKLKRGLKKAVAKGARAVSRGARNVARKVEGGETKRAEAPKAAPKKAEKPADPWEGSATTPPKAKPKAATKKAAAPKPKAKAPAKKKKSSNLDNLLASIRNEETSVERIDRISREKVAQRASAAKKEKEDKERSASAFQAHKKEVLAKGGSPADALDSWQKKKMQNNSYELDGHFIDEGLKDRLKKVVQHQRKGTHGDDDELTSLQKDTQSSVDRLKKRDKKNYLERSQARIAARKSEDAARAMHPKPGVRGHRVEEAQINEMPYQVMGSPDGKNEKKIGKPVKSRKYADARAAELEDTHKKTGGKYRSQYVEEVQSEGLFGGPIQQNPSGPITKQKPSPIKSAPSKIQSAPSKIQSAPSKIQSGPKITQMNSYEPDGEQIDEKTLTKMEMKKREEIVKSMKDKKAYFEKRYPGRGEEVMYATATKMAKKIAEQNLDEGLPLVAAGLAAAAAAPYLAKKFAKPAVDKAIDNQRKTSLIGGDKRMSDINRAAGMN